MCDEPSPSPPAPADSSVRVGSTGSLERTVLRNRCRHHHLAEQQGSVGKVCFRAFLEHQLYELLGTMATVAVAESCCLYGMRYTLISWRWRGSPRAGHGPRAADWAGGSRRTRGSVGYGTINLALTSVTQPSQDLRIRYANEWSY